MALCPLLFDEGLRDLEMRDSYKFFLDAIISGVVTAEELRLLFNVRLHGIPYSWLEEHMGIPQEYLRLNTVSVRLRLLAFSKHWGNRPR